MIGTRAASLEGNGTVTLIRDWAPFAAVLIAYELMRDLASKLGVPRHSLVGVERALFGPATLPKDSLVRETEELIQNGKVHGGT